MVQVSSIFGHILRFFSRTIFDAAVHKHQGDKQAKGMTCWGQFIALMFLRALPLRRGRGWMTCWGQFIALMFCHLGRGESLREITGGLAASEGKLKHLGLDRAPARSTLAYANEHRPWQIYRTVFEDLVRRSAMGKRALSIASSGSSIRYCRWIPR